MHLPCLRDNLRSTIKGEGSEIVIFKKKTFMEHTDSESHRQKLVRTGTAELQGQAVYPEHASLSADSFIAFLHLLAHKLPRTGTLPALSTDLIPAPRKLHEA